MCDFSSVRQVLFFNLFQTSLETRICLCLFKCKHLSVSFPLSTTEPLSRLKKSFKDKIWKLSDTNYRNIDIPTFLVVNLKAVRWVDLKSLWWKRVSKNISARSEWNWQRSVIFFSKKIRKKSCSRCGSASLKDIFQSFEGEIASIYATVVKETMEFIFILAT